MRTFRSLWLFTLVPLCVLGCTRRDFSYADANAPFRHKVEVRETEDGYRVFRDGKPFFIRGAGGHTFLDTLVAYGGTTIRTWTTEGLDTILDQAHERGLAVMVGLDVVPERNGLDYSDKQMVAAQLARIEQDVRRYKDHPAVLIWGIGNELDLHYTDESVWGAVNDIAKMIKTVDPDHPTTTMIMPNAHKTRLIAEQCPDIDILSLNVFGGVGYMPERMQQFWWGWKGPYLISEFGGLGWWEVQYTDWNAPAEMDGFHRAQKWGELYDQSIKSDSTHCLGGFVFYWGNKQERTHTYFSMFSEEGYKSPMADMASYQWRGKWPANRAPKLDSIYLKDQMHLRNIYLMRGEKYEAGALASDFDGDSIEIRWSIYPEGNYFMTTGGDAEACPQPVSGIFDQQTGKLVGFRAPDTPGPYRIFVNLFDGHNNFTAGNLPFYVMEHEVW